MGQDHDNVAVAGDPAPGPEGIARDAAEAHAFALQFLGVLLTLGLAGFSFTMAILYGGLHAMLWLEAAP